MLGFILVLGFKNSIKKLEQLKFNFKNILLSTTIFVWAILSLNKISEFLYFNF
jgi:MBOAT family protein